MGNVTTPSYIVSNNTTPPFQTNHSIIPENTTIINTNVTLTNPFLLNIKQASNSSTRNIKLPQELEPLRTVILSQHTALENHIKDLGSTCLNFTTVIEQKKESANKLHTDKRIPRSLRIKCELSTSPSYESNSDFITLKRELQEALNTFTTKGLNVLKKWSLININLLTQDRCHNIMQRAMIILDGLYTYWKNILDPIHRPSPIENNPILFLIKIYFNEESNPDINKLIKYFELSPPEILIIITKIITKNTNNTFNTQLLNSLDLNAIDTFSEIQIYLITETLKSFDQILKTSIISVWESNRTKIRHSEASQILKAKMDSQKTTSATISTALAINMAMSNLNTNNTQEQATQLRISNLEKKILQQTETNKEILNVLRKHQEPPKQHRETSKRPFLHPLDDVVDLTDNSITSPDKLSLTNKKRPRQNIQWDSTIRHIQQYNPESTPKQLFASSTTLSTTKSFSGQPKQTFGLPTPFGPTSPFLDNTRPFLGQMTTPYPTTIYHPPFNITNTQHPYIHTSPLSNHSQMLTPPNNTTQAHISSNPFSHQKQTTKGYHEGKYRGRRRGFS